MARHIDIAASAFEAFYDQRVVVRGKRTDGSAIAETVEACVFEGGFDDPFDAESVASDRRAVEVLIPFYAWRDDSPPQVGDIVEVYGDLHDRLHLSKFAITSVDVKIGDFDIKAKEVVK